jgi:phospholipase C
MSVRRLFASLAIAALGATLVSAPSPGGAQPFGARASDAERLTLLRKNVKYVFVIYQENRSFDSYFGTFPGAEGLYSRAPEKRAGFDQPIVNVDGTSGVVQPFRIGKAEYAADTDDVDHSHGRILAKMDVVDGAARMDRFATTEETKYSPSGNPSLLAKPFGELAMAHEDCETIPFLWKYANTFVLFDHVFQNFPGPSTPGNLAILGAQTGMTQALLHPDQKPQGNGDRGPGVPVAADANPFWGSAADTTTVGRQPANPKDGKGAPQRNLTYATLPLTLQGKSLPEVTQSDRDAKGDLPDVLADVVQIGATGGAAIPWGWYQEGYDHEATDAGAAADSNGSHASYVTHHNAPQYFGYIANNPQMLTHLHGLGDFGTALAHHALPPGGGLYYIKGGTENTLGLKPFDPDAKVRKAFLGDDDHPAYADSQISEAMVADTVDRIARSPYWSQSAIVITWDDSEGDYDHVPPPVRASVSGESVVSEGPRVPLIVISPYAKTHDIEHASADQASVVKLVDALFGLTPLARLPDEQRAAALGKAAGATGDLLPADAPDNGLSDLLGAFDLDRLQGHTPPVPASEAVIPDATVRTLPYASGYGCKEIGIVPTDIALGIPNIVPPDFNPRPRTNPTLPAPATP